MTSQSLKAGCVLFLFFHLGLNSSVTRNLQDMPAVEEFIPDHSEEHGHNDGPRGSRGMSSCPSTPASRRQFFHGVFQT